ncbi:MAG: response regulator [Pseudomonadota bacterium]
MEAAAPGHVLVVDDNRTVRTKMSIAVKRLGHSVEQAEDGGPALDLLRNGSFDLMLLDIEMPDMDGFAVLEAMEADPDLRDIPVIVISAIEEMDAIVRAIKLGAQDFMPKSFDPVLFEARISASLDKKRLRDLDKDYMRQAHRLAEAAALIEADDFEPSQLDVDTIMARGDALGGLARVLKEMAGKVHDREQTLKRQVLELQIKIDKSAQAEQVNTIVDTDYFRDLRGRADDLRRTFNAPGDSE